MPTIRIPGALLALSGPTDNGPWSWDTWRSITGLDSAPFSQDPTDHLPKHWTPSTAATVRSFANKFWSLSENDRISFMTRRNDNDATGREAWNNLISEGWNKDWKIHETIVKLLEEHQVHPYMVMRRLKVKKVRLVV